jgi:hypothetical protein
MAEHLSVIVPVPANAFGCTSAVRWRNRLSPDRYEVIISIDVRAMAR